MAPVLANMTNESFAATVGDLPDATFVLVYDQDLMLLHIAPGRGKVLHERRVGR